ncbi:cold-shock protein [Qipengyuania sp.]|uniref:cold-shock protein n=1 Tax=Qipengyuania sp. TaxID=2004515 RepID=UPI0035176B51
MSHYGNIKSYDTGKGRGTISPEKGGEPLAFVKADLQREAAEPKVGQRYGYETRQVGGGKPQAINLRQQEQEQVRQQGEKIAGRQQAH